jgi:hypothetical protein
LNAARSEIGTLNAQHDMNVRTTNIHAESSPQTARIGCIVSASQRAPRDLRYLKRMH